MRHNSESPTDHNRPANVPELEYRPDIDGLRGIAVLLVLFFHAGFSPFAGGFVGVDIFFVISGYLITQIILRGQEKKEFSIPRFYERRIRRIIPALFTVLIFVIVVSMIVLLPYDLQQNGKAILSALSFTANFEFWRQSGYFNPAAQYKPLLHTWSLAIEEQYYLFYPLFLIVTAKMRRPHVLGILLVLFLLSVTLCVVVTWRHPTGAFFFTPPRAWEILLGCVVAFLPPLRSRPSAELLSLAGACAVVLSSPICGLKVFEFPGYWALLPCGGAALLLYGNATAPTLARRLLSWKPLVGVGLISYSLYLWHWPLFAFARAWTLHPLTLPITLLLIAAAFALAFASWRWIERPFRRANGVVSFKQIFAVTAGAGAGLAVAGLVLVASAGLPLRYNKNVAALAAYSGYVNTATWRNLRGDPRCNSSSNVLSDYESAACLVTDPRRKNVLLWGDSHASHFARTLQDRLGSTINFLLATKPACMPIVGAKDASANACSRFSRFVLARSLAAGLDEVVISAQWSDPGRGDRLVAALVHDVKCMRDSGIAVVVLGPSPFYRAEVPEILARQASTGLQAFEPDSFLTDEPFNLDAEMKSAFTGIDGVSYVSLIDALCRQRHCKTLVGDGVPMYWDRGHFTREASQFLVESVIAVPVVARLRADKATKPARLPPPACRGML